MQSKADSLRTYLDLYLNKIRINCTLIYLFRAFILGAGLEKYNKYRGICDACEVYDIDPKALVLDDYGEGILNLETLSVKGKRFFPYDELSYSDRVNDISNRSLTYSTLSPHDIGNHYVLRKLIKHAFSNAVRRASWFRLLLSVLCDGIFLCSLDLLDKHFPLKPCLSKDFSYNRN